MGQCDVLQWQLRVGLKSSHVINTVLDVMSRILEDGKWGWESSLTKQTWIRIFLLVTGDINVFR